MNKSLILNRIKIANNLKTDTELAGFLGISKFTLSNWRSRDTLDFELVLSKCELLDLNWLIKEEDEEATKIEDLNINLMESEKQVKNPNTDSFKLIVENYESLAKEFGYLKREYEDLKDVTEKSKSNKSDSNPVEKK